MIGRKEGHVRYFLTSGSVNAVRSQQFHKLDILHIGYAEMPLEYKKERCPVFAKPRLEKTAPLELLRIWVN